MTAIESKFSIIDNPYPMQANCCVFPAPKQYQFTRIISNILLIPKQPHQPVHYYHHKYLLHCMPEDNDYLQHLRKRGRRDRVGGNERGAREGVGHERLGQEVIARERVAPERMVVPERMALQSKYNQTNVPKVSEQIPCVFLPARNTDKIMVFFHGNGEDLSSSYDFAYYICQWLNITVLVVEYRGYSIYSGETRTEHIIEDAKIVMNFLTDSGYTSQDILLFGRSIGGAIAFQTASMFDSCCLILLSPFLSLKRVAQDLYGSCASVLLKQSLDNQSIAQKVACPILIIHGIKDNLVPYHHSISILSQCRSYTRLKLIQNMTHTKFNFANDFIRHVKQFCLDFKILNPK